MLVLRAERHEHRTGQRERDAEEQPGVLEDTDELLADVFYRVHFHTPALTLRPYPSQCAQ